MKLAKSSFSSLSVTKHFSCTLTPKPHNLISLLVLLLLIACIYFYQTVTFPFFLGIRTQPSSNTTVNIAVWFLASSHFTSKHLGVLTVSRNKFAYKISLTLITQPPSISLSRNPATSNSILSPNLHIAVRPFLS